MSKLFDLNIEEVLDHWEVEHAIREIIAMRGTRHIDLLGLIGVRSEPGAGDVE